VRNLDVDDAISAIVNCLRQNMTDPQSRASGSYWIGDDWIDERLRKYRWPQISIFHVGSSTEEARKGYVVYYPLFQIDIFASGKAQKRDLAHQVKNILLHSHRKSLLASGVNILSLEGESDVIEDERLPMKAYRKSLTIRAMVYSSGS